MKKRLALIVLSLLAVLLAAYLIVPNWILAKPREALIEQIRTQLQTDWQSEDVFFAGEYAENGETFLWFKIDAQNETYYRLARCRLLNNGRYRLLESWIPSVYCTDIVYFMDVFLINNPECRAIIAKGSNSGQIIRRELTPDDLPYVYCAEPPFHSNSIGFYDAAGEEMQFR